MSSRIILFSTELLPMKDVPATGWGVRGKGIYEGLKKCGFELFFAPHKNAVKGYENTPSELKRLAFDKTNIDNIIKEISPDMIIFSPWPAASELAKTDIPVAIDLGGPIILENLFIPDWDIIHPLESKIEALSKGDFFIFGNKRQKNYYLLYLILAGIEIKNDCTGVVPMTLSPDLPEHKDQFPDKFVTGGVFYPWQNPFPSLNAVVKGIEQSKKGKLKIYRGKHPTWDQFPGIFKDPEDYIGKSQRIEYADIVPYEKLLDDYIRQGIAIDLYEENFERKLAAPNRTITYLWCGLPVIIPEYFEISKEIEEYDAGWIVSPSDEEEIINVVKSILDQPDLVRKKSLNAQKLVKEKFIWGKNMESLEKFCNAPLKQKKNPPIIGRIMAENSKIKFQNTEFINERNELQKIIKDTCELLETVKEELRQTTDQLNYIRNSIPYRCLKKLKHLFKF